MKLSSFEAITTALEAAGVRYLVAGGLAVCAHGCLRFTKNLNLVVQLMPENIAQTFAALQRVGYCPSDAITSAQFANADSRNGWARDNGAQVLPFRSDAHVEMSIGVHADEPFAFDDEYSNALAKPLHGSTLVRFVSLQTLIAMKAAAVRPQDLIDVEQLRLRLPDDSRRKQLDAIDWSLTSWEGARREQMRQWAALPLERMILALEEMQALGTQLSSNENANPRSL